jgi:uncharacterized protein YndB with AHSA1/START domain
MEEVHANVYIHAPIERVFDAVSDHESFVHAEGVTSTKIIRPGTDERNGLGCLRDVRVGPRVHYVEEVTAWERPSSFEYQVRESSRRIRHHGSRIRFIPRGEGTEVDWTSRVELTIPLVGRSLGPLFRRILTAAFTELLLAAKARLEAANTERTP